MASCHVLGDCRLSNLKPEFQQVTMDSGRAPQRVFFVHSPDKITQLALDLGFAYLTSGFPAPVGSKPGPMPPQDSLRLHDSGCGKRLRRLCPQGLRLSGLQLRLMLWLSGISSFGRHNHTSQN